MAEGRDKKFSVEECLTLTNIMGEQNIGRPHLTNHQLIKHRFTDGITKATKIECWKTVATTFRSHTGTDRAWDKIEKKWLNMVPQHRLLLSDYKRERALTGGGQSPKELSLLTQAVADVIGKESASINGAVGTSMDTSFNSINNQQVDEDPLDARVDTSMELDDILFTAVTGTVLEDAQAQELQTLSTEELTRKKLMLEILYFQKKLKE